MRPWLATRGSPVLVCVGCDGAQSALAPAGVEAETIATLFWGMIIGAGVIWAGVVGLAMYAAYGRREPLDVAKARALVVGGGLVLPTVMLTGLLIYGLMLLPSLLERAPPGSLRILVTGEQYWWRVRYLPAKGAPVDLANEIRLPAGEPVEFELRSPDVIHSFWIPALGGKMDMIPGRTTHLRLRPTRTGVFRGVCAEYCGASHALMAFAAVVTSKLEFERWLDTQRQPARGPGNQLEARGAELFTATGCGACHAVRGSRADGLVGPDLTHVGSRLTLGAGIARTGSDDFERWTARPDVRKPGVHMPAFGMLPGDEARAIAAYLASLR
jgi:cytochrome c oxidase subunit II